MSYDNAWNVENVSITLDSQNARKVKRRSMFNLGLHWEICFKSLFSPPTDENGFSLLQDAYGFLRSMNNIAELFVKPSKSKVNQHVYHYK